MCATRHWIRKLLRFCQTNRCSEEKTETQTKRIEMLGSTTTKVEIYQATISGTDGQFTMEVNLTKVHKSQLMEIDNPRYKELLSK